MAFIELLNRLLKALDAWLYSQRQKQHEQTVQNIQDNPAEFLADHFGGVPKRQPDAGDADKADPEYKPNP